MKNIIISTLVIGGALLSGGCATKKYVAKTIDPVSSKLDQVAKQTDSHGQKLDQHGQKIDQTSQSLDQTRQSLEKDETELSATSERALSADKRAGDALQRADAAGQKADLVGRDLSELRGVVTSLDDYKQVAQSTVNFPFASDRLNSEAKQALDQMVMGQTQYKRFFVAVEGFTDRTGPDAYNSALSKRRADAVVAYLVAQHNIPIYRIHMVGLGKDKPVDEARNRAAQAKNRRVEVTLFSADQSTASAR
jgi:outer membrane protein OmpA-like peptidoglycan-associated protein